MDYKFKLLCVQEAAGSENAKIKISHGATVIVAEQEITSTDTSSPTEVTFEVTGLNAPASGETCDLKIELLNDYYVDTDTDRNVVIIESFYCYKSTGRSDYAIPAVTWKSNVETAVFVEHFDEKTMAGGRIESGWIGPVAHDISTSGDGEDQGGSFTAGSYIRIDETYVDMEIPTESTWTDHFGDRENDRLEYPDSFKANFTEVA